MYDYLVVGAGLFGCVFAREAATLGKKVLVIDRRNHIGGNIYTEDIQGIKVHKYGPHLFHTKNKMVWDYVNRFTEFNHYRHHVKANYCGKIYSMPFNMMTYNQLWGSITPEDAKQILDRDKIPIENPSNLEEYALAAVGKTIYDTLIYGYTKKQWMREPRELPASIIKRIPLRMTYDENYFDDPYQGVPKQGYTHLIENMIDGIEVKLNEELGSWQNIAKELVYSGSPDELFNYEFGVLEYRCVSFKTEVLEGNAQGIGQMNYTDESVPHTRIIEHKHFYFQNSPLTVITTETPVPWELGKERHYPINDDKNNAIYAKYAGKAKNENIILGGRLGRYQYYDMDQTIANALSRARHI